MATVKLHAGGLTRLGQYQRFLTSLDSHLGTTPYDVIHAMLPVRRCDIYHPHAGVAAEAVARGHQKHASAAARATAWASNQLNLKRRRFAAVERELLTGPNPPIILCLSGYIRTAVRRHYALPDSRLITLLNGVDLARFDPAARPQAGEDIRRKLGIASDRIVALMIAQDFARKGVGQSITALSRIADPRLMLVVVGKPDPRAYQAMARDLGVASRVLFAGATIDAAAFYQAADFFVLPTRHDPCSLVVLEALAMGLPVISTSQNGACEVMADGQEGYVLNDASDIDGLTAGMRALLDPPNRQRMHAAAMVLRPRLSAAAHVDAMVELYGSITGRRERADMEGSSTKGHKEPRR